MMRETFTLSIELGNDAMQTRDDLADALESVARKVRTGQDDGYVFDYNGNRVGEYDLREEMTGDD